MPLASAAAGFDRDQQKLVAENVVEEADSAVEDRGLDDFVPGHGEDVPDQHVFQVLGLAGGFAHGENSRGRGHGVGDSDEGFLRDVRRGGCERKQRSRAR